MFSILTTLLVLAGPTASTPGTLTRAEGRIYDTQKIRSACEWNKESLKLHCDKKQLRGLAQEITWSTESPDGIEMEHHLLVHRATNGTMTLGGIRMHLRNRSENRVVIDLSQTIAAVNGERVELTPQEFISPKADITAEATTAIAPDQEVIIEFTTTASTQAPYVLKGGFVVDLETTLLINGMENSAKARATSTLRDVTVPMAKKVLAALKPRKIKKTYYKYWGAACCGLTAGTLGVAAGTFVPLLIGPVACLIGYGVGYLMDGKDEYYTVSDGPTPTPAGSSSPGSQEDVSY